MREDDSCGKVTYMGVVQGPEKVIDTWVKTVRVGTIERGFTASEHVLKHICFVLLPRISLTLG
jgi:hypothetical protein